MVDRILPGDVPYRQWVVTFPWVLARRLAFDAELTSAVLRLVIRVLFSWQREHSPAPARRSHSGAVVFVQRFSDGAGLFIHLHILAPLAIWRGRGLSVPGAWRPITYFANLLLAVYLLAALTASRVSGSEGDGGTSVSGT